MLDSDREADRALTEELLERSGALPEMKLPHGALRNANVPLAEVSQSLPQNQGAPAVMWSEVYGLDGQLKIALMPHNLAGFSVGIASLYNLHKFRSLGRWHSTTNDQCI